MAEHWTPNEQTPVTPESELSRDRYWTPRRIWWQNNVRHRFGRRIDGWLFAWIEGAEAVYDDKAELIGEGDDGDIYMPRGITEKGPRWQGYWCWWKPTHWPSYLRSRRRNAYAFIDLGGDE